MLTPNENATEFQNYIIKYNFNEILMKLDNLKKIQLNFFSQKTFKSIDSMIFF